MAESEVDRVVKLRKMGKDWHVIQAHDGKEFARETCRNYGIAAEAEADLIRLGYRAEQ